MPKWAQALLALSLGASSFVASDAMQVGADQTVVTGTVFDADTGDPIEGITVTLRRFDERFGPGDGLPLAAGLSGPDGTFRIDSDFGLATNGFRYTLEAIDGADRYGARFFIPFDPIGPSDVTIEMQRGGMVRGTVYDVGYQNPVADTCVIVTDLDGNAVLGGYDPLSCSDASGAYRIRRLPPGDYLLRFRTPNPGRHGSVIGVPVTVVADATATVNVELPAPTPTFISGVVTSAVTGEPIAGIRVFADTMDGNGFYEAFNTETGPDGAYTLDVSGYGGSLPFFLSFTDEASGLWAPLIRTVVYVQPGYTEALAVALQPAGTIEGVITAEEIGPLPYVCFGTRNLETNDLVGFDCADESGRYRTQALAPGSYQLEISSYLPFHWVGPVGPIEVVGGKSTVVDIELRRVRTRITGEVVDADTGRPVRGVDVTVSVAGGGPLQTVRTGADGAFSIDVQPWVGLYSDFDVRVDDPRDRYRPSGPILVVVQQGYDEPLGIELQAATTRIVGEVTDRVSGEPIAGARVVVTPLGRGGSSVRDTTGRDGAFSIDVERFLRNTRRFRVEVVDPSGRYESAVPFTVSMQRGYDEVVGITLEPVAREPLTPRFSEGSLDPPPAVNRESAGDAVELEWRVLDERQRLVRDPGVVDSITWTPTSCRTWRPTGAQRGARSDSGLTVSRQGVFRFVWNTPRTPGCVVVSIELVDGSALTARVNLIPRPRR